MQTQYIEDEEFGRVAVDVRTQARHLIAHVPGDGMVRVTIPPLTPLESVRRMLDAHREGIRQLRAKSEAQHRRVDFDFSVKTDLLSLRVEPVDMPVRVVDGRLQLRLTRRAGETVVGLPRELSLDRWQEPLQEFVVEQLRWQARVLLTPRLKDLAQKHGFTYKRLTFKKSRTNWGSCSNLGNINLSVFLMLLPARLVDYVLLHELCHTIHQDHSPAFWALLDSVMGVRAKDFQRELRAYRPLL